jgi:hypothetical protein
MISARLGFLSRDVTSVLLVFAARKFLYIVPTMLGEMNTRRNAMAPSMLDKKVAHSEHAEWPAAIKAEFERESRSPNGCVGTELLSETDKVRVWIIRLKPGERVGFHRHVLDYFWTSVNGGRGRQHLMDGSTVEHTYAPGETRHETYGPGEFKVHDLENLGSENMIFNTIEFLDSANKPLPIPDHVRDAAA